MARTQARRSAALNTPLGDDKLLLKSFRVTEQIGRPFEIELSLTTEEESIDPEALLGQNVTLRMDLDERGTKSRYFNGYVSRFVMAGNAGHLPNYHMTVVPFIWLLGRTSDCRIWQGQQAKDIVQDLIKERGFSDIDTSLNETYVEREFCVQYRETVLNFCHRLMEEDGFYYFFKHEDGKHTLVFADDRSGHPTLDETLHFGKAPDSKDTQSVPQWTAEHEAKSGAYSLLDFNFKTPRKPVQGHVASPSPHAQADQEMLDYPGGFDNSGEGDRLARVRLEELHAAHEVARGSSNNRNIGAGTIFTLEDHPDGGQNKEWLVTAMTLDWSVTDFSSGGKDASRNDHFSCGFSAIPAQTPYRLPRITPEPVIIGPQPALVVGPSGEEIYTDEYGRIKVLFYWDRYAKANDQASIFIRVAQIAAGKQYGAIFIPRVGQEVLVEFTDGDPDRPVVTGVVYNGLNKPPYPLPDNKTRSVIKTNSSKGGGGFNELYFEDAIGDEQIYTHAQKDFHLRIKNDRFEIIKHDTHLIVENDRIENIKHDDNLHINGDHKTTVDGDQSLTVGGERATKIKGADGLDVSADQAIKVGNDHGLSVGGGLSQKAGGKFSAQSKLDMQLKSGKDYAVDAAMNVHIKGGMVVVIEAGMQLSLKAGGSFIDISPAGIAISGQPMLMLNSGGAAGSGAGSTPDDPASPHAPKDPADPTEAIDTNPGVVEDQPEDRSHENSGSTTSTAASARSPVAEALESAAQSGDAFTE